MSISRDSGDRTGTTLMQRLQALVVQLILLVASVLLVAATFERAVEATVLHDKDIDAFAAAFSAGLAVAICCIPNVLMVCAALMCRRAANDRVRQLAARIISLPEHFTLAHDDALRISIVEEANMIWAYEVAAAGRRSDLMFQYAQAYGFVCLTVICLALVGCRATFFGAPDFVPQLRPFLIACAAAVAVAFSRDFGRTLVRAANRDSSAQMMAWATRRLLLSVTATATLCVVGLLGKVRDDMLSSSAGAVLLGIAVATLGDRAVNHAGDRLAGILGIKKAAPPEAGELAALDGLNDDDVVRLAEEGIDSIHALAFYSTPKLFFNTPYTLPRICDWQDQALLVARLGTVKARLFRDQLAIRGALELCDLANRYVAGVIPEQERSDIAKMLGFATPSLANQSMFKFAKDRLIARLSVFLLAAPTFATDTPSVKPDRL